jgi:hypothetical protein
VTGRRSRIVAAQAVVVGLLMIVVFVTLLRPDASNPLFEITTPGATEASGLPAPGSYVGADHRGDNGRQTRPGTIRGDGAGPAVGGATAGPAVAGSDLATPEAGDDGGGEPSPTDDQYADTLTQLATRLN